MSKLRKIIDAVYTASTFCVASFGVAGTATLAAILKVANKGFDCLPSPPVDIDAVFDAKGFNVSKFIEQVMAQESNISLPIDAKLAFTGAGSCVSDVVRTTLLVSVPIITVYAGVCLAKGISDCSKDSTPKHSSPKHFGLNGGYDDEDYDDDYDYSLNKKRRCC